jgi:hypothetical protein
MYHTWHEVLRADTEAAGAKAAADASKIEQERRGGAPKVVGEPQASR